MAGVPRVSAAVRGQQRLELRDAAPPGLGAVGCLGAAGRGRRKAGDWDGDAGESCPGENVRKVLIISQYAVDNFSAFRSCRRKMRDHNRKQPGMLHFLTTESVVLSCSRCC